MATLVSAIIPTFNRAALIGEAIESLLRQTYPACEVVVVDDGSTDDTPTVLAQFGERIRTIRTSNRGCAAARNVGIGLARGDYLAFVDSDDVAPPERLALQVPVLNGSPDVGFVYGPSVAFGPDLPGEQVLLPVRPDADGWVFEALFLTTRIGFDSVLLRRAAVEQAGGFDESLRLNEDTDLLLRVALDWKAVCLDVPTGRHRWHGGRKSRDLVALWRALLWSMERLLEQRPEVASRLGGKAPRRLAAVRGNLAEALARRSEIDEARLAARSAWRLAPSGRLALWRLLLAWPAAVPVGIVFADYLAKGCGFLRARLRRR